MSGIVNRELIDIHKIFQAPKLFSVTEVEFDLETKAVIVDEFIESQGQIATEKDDMGHFLRFEIGFDDDDNIEFVGDEFVPHGHLIDFGLDAIEESSLFEIFVGDMVIVEFGSILFVGAALFLFPLVGEIQRGIIASFGDEVHPTLAHPL